MLFTHLVEKLSNSDSSLIDSYIGSNPDIIQGQSLDMATKNNITFLEENSYLMNKLDLCLASAILIPDNPEIKKFLTSKSISWCSFLNPKIAFAEVLEVLNPKFNYPHMIHESSVIEDNVTLGNDIYIGPNVYIGSNTNIGNKCIIHPGVVIYNNVNIGENSEFYANCVIHPGSIIGNNCIIHSNVVIGSEGFGFIPTKRGWRKMPQTGHVVLENDIEIGSCTTIDRPSVGVTFIGEGTKLDNLVQIGHGVKIGKNCAMASQVGIAGGAIIEDGVILAGQVGVGNRVKIGSGVVASSKCGVHADIEPGQVISGFPAMPNKLWLRCSANFKKLPELAKSLKQISRSDRK